jgi:hypothetical protein
LCNGNSESAQQQRLGELQGPDITSRDLAGAQGIHGLRVHGTAIGRGGADQSTPTDRMQQLVLDTMEAFMPSLQCWALMSCIHSNAPTARLLGFSTC